MKIYGVAILAACFLTGKFLGSLLGELIGINGDVGGVGFAMLLLMLGNYFYEKKRKLHQETKSGIRFWSAMYIPIIIAMAATQNAAAAFSGGWIALVAGLGVTFAAMALVPLLSKIGRSNSSETTD